MQKISLMKPLDHQTTDLLVAGLISLSSIGLFGFAIYKRSPGTHMLSSAMFIAASFAIGSIFVIRRIQRDMEICTVTDGTCIGSYYIKDNNLFHFNVSLAYLYVVWCLIAAFTMLFCLIFIYIINIYVEFLSNGLYSIDLTALHLMLSEHPVPCLYVILSGLAIFILSVNIVTRIYRDSQEEKKVHFQKIYLMFRYTLIVLTILLTCCAIRFGFYSDYPISLQSMPTSSAQSDNSKPSFFQRIMDSFKKKNNTSPSPSFNTLESKTEVPLQTETQTVVKDLSNDSINNTNATKTADAVDDTVNTVNSFIEPETNSSNKAEANTNQMEIPSVDTDLIPAVQHSVPEQSEANKTRPATEHMASSKHKPSISNKLGSLASSLFKRKNKKE